MSAFQHVEITYDSPGRWPGFSFGKRNGPSAGDAPGPVDDKPPLASQATMAEQTSSPWARLDLDTAIRLRWALRDIKAKRTKLTPVSPGDLKTLVEMGPVEMRDDAPVLTNEGHQVLD